MHAHGTHWEAAKGDSAHAEYAPWEIHPAGKVVLRGRRRVGTGSSRLRAEGVGTDDGLLSTEEVVPRPLTPIPDAEVESERSELAEPGRAARYDVVLWASDCVRHPSLALRASYPQLDQARQPMGGCVLAAPGSAHGLAWAPRASGVIVAAICVTLG